MISLLRLDERLIHGSVAVKVAKGYPCDSILVVDDEVVNDPLSIKTLQMASMSIGNVKTFIKNTDEALKILCDPRAESRKIIVICRKIDALYKIACTAPCIEEINFANYGLMLISKKKRTKYFKTLLLDEDEVALAKKVVDLGKPTFYQFTPQDPKTNLAGFFK